MRRKTEPRLEIAVIQPTSLCNLNCRYCYVPNRKDSIIMLPVVLEKIIQQVLGSQYVDNSIQFLWHAGEPLLAGVEFFKNAVNLIRENNDRNLTIRHLIQTNGTKINAEWCEFFRSENFSVGISIDGPQWLHDANRQTWSGRNSHKEALHGYQELKNYGVNSGALCVLTRESLKHPDEVFEFFHTNRFDYVGFNLEEVENANVISSLGTLENVDEITELYKGFFSRLIDLHLNTPDSPRIREYDKILTALARKRVNPDYYREPVETRKFAMLTFAKNGDYTPYSPEFSGFVNKNYNNFVIGNILEDPIDSVMENELFKKIENDIELSISSCATECRFFDLCGGTFNSNKLAENGDLTSTVTLLCHLHVKTLTDIILCKVIKNNVDD